MYLRGKREREKINININNTVNSGHYVDFECLALKLSPWHYVTLANHSPLRQF